MFSTTRKDQTETTIAIKGARAQDTSSNIATLLFQNYDNDVSNVFNMASITMHDSFGNSNSNGFGTLQFATANGSNNLQTCLWIKHNGNVGINTSNPMTPLEVNGAIKAITFQGNGCNLTNLNYSNFAYGNMSVSVGGTGLSNIPYGTILVGNTSNSILIPSNLTWNPLSNSLNVTGSGRYTTFLQLDNTSNAPIPINQQSTCIYSSSNDSTLRMLDSSNNTFILGPYFTNQHAYRYIQCLTASATTTAANLSTYMSSNLTLPYDGLYRVMVRYQAMTTSAITNGLLRTVVYIDSAATGTWHDATEAIIPNTTPVKTDATLVRLTAGSHTFVVQYSSMNGTAVGLLEGLLESYRISN
ncbi:MAG: hypothetical protein H9536_14250 [Aphanizomenon flos-aquae Clear-A1]|nr:hypothetical protein [Aphanizomenon flos-aquae Clear-A1]